MSIWFSNISIYVSYYVDTFHQLFSPYDPHHDFRRRPRRPFDAADWAAEQAWLASAQRRQAMLTQKWCCQCVRPMDDLVVKHVAEPFLRSFDLADVFLVKIWSSEASAPDTLRMFTL